MSVLAIAKFVNQHHNGLPENVAAGFAANDFQVYNERLATFAPAFQAVVITRVNEQINDAWGHARFTEALERVFKLQNRALDALVTACSACIFPLKTAFRLRR